VTASAAEIKKAYVQLALKLHPDKNKDDPNATKKFQELSDAYRVLSNPTARAQYDATGTASESHAESLYDSLEAQLGCRVFAPFTGRLKWLVLMGSPLRQNITEVQRRRVVRIAVELSKFLDDDDVDSVTGTPQFLRVKALMPEMLSSKIGHSLLQVIGSAYIDAARQLSEHVAVGICDNLVVDTVSSIGGIANTAVHAATTAYKVARREAVSEDDLVELIRRISKNDVHDTVSKACELVSKDVSVSEETRRRRIKHLGFLGQYFVSCSQTDQPQGTVPAVQHASSGSV
jgi:hypothetical protein